MRLRELFSEAWRNLASGTARVLAVAVALAAVLTVTVGMDSATISTIRNEHREFRAQGATYWTITASGRVDGERCEALSALPGVVGAGAVRAGGAVRLDILPAASTRVSEVSPGMGPVLGITQPTATGVWVSPGLAATLGADVGETLGAQGRAILVAAVHHLPKAVTSASLSSGLAAPAPIDGHWDECWLDVETHSDSVNAAMSYSVNPSATGEPGDQPQISQLNGSLGRSRNLQAELGARPTQWILLAAPLLAAVVGAVSSRQRRLEHAAARHIGVTRTDLAAITAAEASVWSVAGAAITVAIVGLVHVGLAQAASMDVRADLLPVLLHAASWAALGAAAAIIGAVAQASATSPRQLYRYFRERA